jgi:DNA-binding response OmpR family regulator
VRRLVSTVSPELALLLERDLLRRADLHLVTARSVDELVTLTREGAELCLVEPMLPDGDALDALDAVRATPEGSHVPVVLVVTSDAPQQETSGFAAVLELPATPGAVEELIARLLAEPRRRGLRRPTSTRVRDERGEPRGRLVDIARGGVALRTRRPLTVGASVALQLELPLQPAPLSAQARVLRVAGEHVALALESPSAPLGEALELLIAPPALDGGMAFRPLPRLGDRAAAIGGVLADGPARTALEAFFGTPDGSEAKLVVTDLVPFDERALDRWVALVGAIGATSPLELHGCPAWLRALADRMPRVLGHAQRRTRIASLQVALRCGGCGDESETEARLPPTREVALAAIAELAAAPCFICGGKLALLEPLETMLLDAA